MKTSKFLLLLILLSACLALRSQSVEPATIEISFYGNENFSNNELVENFKGCFGQLWQKYDERAYNYIAQKCSRSLLQSKGFWKAKVIEINSTVRDGVRAVQIVVDEGPRYRIGKVEIEGNEVLSKNEILGMWGQHSGEVADGTKLQDLVYEKLKEKYDDLGFVQYNADFEPDFVEPRGRRVDGLVHVTITIDEGRQFKVRQVIFLGVSEEEEESLRKQFLLKSGDLYGTRKTQNALDALNDTGRFVPVNVNSSDVEIRTDEEVADIDLAIILTRSVP